MCLRRRSQGAPATSSRSLTRPAGNQQPVAENRDRNWEQFVPFCSYPPEVRKIIYTANAIESLHLQLREVLKNRGHFPSDEAAT